MTTIPEWEKSFLPVLPREATGVTKKWSDLEPDEKVVVDNVLLAQLKVRGFTAWLGAQLGADRSTLDKRALAMAEGRPMSGSVGRAPVAGVELESWTSRSWSRGSRRPSTCR